MDEETTPPLFEKELETFRKHLQELLDSSVTGFALIQGEELHSTHDTENDAIDAGYREYGSNVSFLVKEIVEVERVKRIHQLQSGVNRLIPSDSPIAILPKRGSRDINNSTYF